jgi:hypothetical protein
MMALNFVGASMLLGAFVLFAGGYGILYTLGQIRRRQSWIYAGYVCYFAQIIVTIAICLLTPLGIGWQVLIIAGCVACFRIPPLTFAYLELSHR